MENETYKLDELDWRAREKALGTVLASSDEFFSDSIESTICEWKEKLAKLGYIKPQISYSLSFDGRDYVSFWADVDVRTWIMARKLGNKMKAILLAAPHTYLRIDPNWSRGCRIALNCDEYSITDNAIDAMNDFTEMVTDDAETQCGEILSALLREHEWLTSEKFAVQEIENLGYMFYEDGTLA